MARRWHKWTPAQDALLGQLMEAGHSYASAGVAMDLSYNQVRERCRKLEIESIVVNAGPATVTPDIPPIVPRYDGALNLTGDVIIVSDVHCPCTDWVLATRAALIGRKYLSEPRRLVIAGDLMNFDTFSKYPQVVPLPSLRQEIDAAWFALNLWCETFDQIYFTLGNHDYRWLKAMDGAFDGDTFVDVMHGLLRHNDKLTISIYPYLTIETGIGTWHITHPSEYSQIPLAKARKLVNKYKNRHVLVTHQHHIALGLDESGQFIMVDLPALVDPVRLAYVQLADGTKPTMKRGFAMLRGGYPYLFSDVLTDWEFWLE